MISVAFLRSVLNGLHRSPRIVVDEDGLREPGVLAVADVSWLHRLEFGDSFSGLGLPPKLAIDCRVEDNGHPH